MLRMEYWKKNQKKAELQQMYLADLVSQRFPFLLLTSLKDDQHIWKYLVFIFPLRNA